MLRLFKAICLMTLIWVVPVVNAAPPSLRVPHIADAAPFVIMSEQQQPVSGMLFEIYQLLSVQLGLKMQMDDVPRQQVGRLVLQGDIDLYCNATPLWFPDPRFRWSPPLFIHRDLVVSRHRYADFAHFLQQASGRIGTTYEYIYPTLQRLFNDNQLQRVDSVSPRQSLKLLQAGVLDAVVVSELELNYFVQRHHDFATLVVAQDEIRCMYSPHLTASQVARLDLHIMQLIKQGELIRIVDKYQ